MKNHLENLFANIKNGQLAKRSFVYHPKKNICEAFLRILWDEGFIVGYTNSSDKSNTLKIFLKYKQNRPAINSIKFISRPGRRLYSSASQIWKINSNKNFIIFSTNQGLKSIFNCKRNKVGGEPVIVIVRYKKYFTLIYT